MSNTNWIKRTARVYQDATGVTYTEAVRLAHMSEEVRSRLVNDFPDDDTVDADSTLLYHPFLHAAGPDWELVYYDMERPYRWFRSISTGVVAEPTRFIHDRYHTSFAMDAPMTDEGLLVTEPSGSDSWIPIAAAAGELLNWSQPCVGDDAQPVAIMHLNATGYLSRLERARDGFSELNRLLQPIRDLQLRYVLQHDGHTIIDNDRGVSATFSSLGVAKSTLDKLRDGETVTWLVWE